MSKEFHLLTVKLLNIFKCLIKIKEIQHNFHHSKHRSTLKQYRPQYIEINVLKIQQKLTFKMT